MDRLLTLLNVPKGTRLIPQYTGTAGLTVSFALIAPDTGQLSEPGGVVGSRGGYLREVPGILGQNSVDHFKLGGSIVDLSFSDGTSQTNGSGEVSTTGVPWIRIPVNTRADGKGTSSLAYVHYVVPRGSYIFASAKKRDTSGQYAGQMSGIHAGSGWLDSDTFFIASASVAQYAYRNGKYWSCNFTIAVRKLDRARMVWGGANTSYNTGWTLTFNPVFVDASYFESGVMDAVARAALTITTYGNNYASLTPTYTVRDPNSNVQIPQFENFEEKFFPQDLNPDRWGDLASDCYSQIYTWDSNGAAYLRDTVLSVRAAKETVALAKSLIGSKNPAGLAKSLASLFLSFRYGWCLQVKDSLSLMALDFDRAYPHGLARRSSSRTYERNGCLVTARMGVYFQPYSTKISELEGFLRQVDLNVTMENIWDLVPLSFVVDWFTGFGDLLDRMDQMSELDSFDIRLVGTSVKTTKSLVYRKTSGRSDWHGIISATKYRRLYGSIPYEPSLTSYRTSTQKFDHWLEGTALIIQRL